MITLYDNVDKNLRLSYELMTVQDLIDRLETLPKDAILVDDYHRLSYDLSNVKLVDIEYGLFTREGKAPEIVTL